MTISEQQETLIAQCPACGGHVPFTFLGIQRFPRRVAERTGLPEEQALYSCTHCQTTLMRQSIMPTAS